jgi:hypothetical protein
MVHCLWGPRFVLAPGLASGLEPLPSGAQHPPLLTSIFPSQLRTFRLSFAGLQVLQLGQEKVGTALQV